MPPSFKNILIIRSDRIGDVVLTTPAIHILREAFPEARISVLVSSGNEVLLEGHSDIDEVLVDIRRAGSKKPTGFLSLVGMLRKKKFDCCINYHTKKRTNLAAFLAGIPVRIGFKNKKFSFLLTQPLKDERHLGKKHEVRYCLDVLEALSMEVNELKLSLPVPVEHEGWFKELALDEGRPMILFHIGASDPAKRWPEDKFAELMTHLNIKKEAHLILVGSPDTEEVASTIEAAVSFPLQNFVGQTSLGQLMYLIHRCDLMVSNDSGPVHIAAAYDKPVVSIFTRNQPGINPERWQPLGNHARYVSVAPEVSIANKKAGAAPAEYLQIIDTKEVIEAVDDVFKL